MPARSIAEARNWAAPGGVRRTTRFALSLGGDQQLGRAAGPAGLQDAGLAGDRAASRRRPRGAGRRRACRRRRGPWTAPSSSRSRDRVAWVTAKPSRGEQLGQLGLRADRAPSRSATRCRAWRCALVSAATLPAVTSRASGLVTAALDHAAPAGTPAAPSARAAGSRPRPRPRLRARRSPRRRSPCRGRRAGSAGRRPRASASATARLVERRSGAKTAARSACSASWPIDTQVSVTRTSAPRRRRERVVQ